MKKEEFEQLLKDELTFNDEMFNSLKKEFGAELLEKSAAVLDEYEAGLANKLKVAASGIEEIALMSDDAIKAILDECSASTIAKAMTLMDDAARQKIYSNMSEDAAVMLKEDFEYMGPVSKKEAMQAKHEIFQAVYSEGNGGQE